MSDNTNPEQKKLTPEQIKEYEDKMQSFYKSRMPILSSQVDYLELLARKHKAELSILRDTVEHAQLSTSMKPQKPLEDEQGD